MIAGRSAGATSSLSTTPFIGPERPIAAMSAACGPAASCTATAAASHQASGSASAQPGCGVSSGYGADPVPTIDPWTSRTSALSELVPRSIPRNTGRHASRSAQGGGDRSTSGLGRDQAVAVRRLSGDEWLLLRWPDDLIDQAVVLCHLRRHEEVALDVALDLLLRPTSVLRIDANDDLPESENLARMDLDIRGLRRPHAAAGLVQHDLAVRQRQPLALRAPDQDQ